MKQIPRLICLLSALVGALLAWPAAAQTTAQAIATTVNGFVVAVTVTEPGSGYVEAHAVNFEGGGGSGVTATAVVKNGAVSQIVVTTAGSGYTNAPTVIIAAPPQPATLSLAVLAHVTVQGEVGVTYVVEYSDSVASLTAWRVLAVVTLKTPSETVVDAGSAGRPNRYYRVRLANTYNPDPERLVWIQPGTFWMGSSGNEVGRETDEHLLTPVSLTSEFLIGKREVTQEEFAALMGANPSGFTGLTNLPVENVLFSEAVEYCRRLTETERQVGRLPSDWVYRLPTEAEWEFACRAGTTNRFSFGDDPDYSLSGNFAWHLGNSGNTSHPVGTKEPNPWGLFDIHGNVWEWCWGQHSDELPGIEVTDPIGIVKGAIGVVRGGSWFADSSLSRSASRNWWYYESRTTQVGFRVVVGKPLPE